MTMGVQPVITPALSKGDHVGTVWGPGVVVDASTYAGQALVRPVGITWGSTFDRTHGRWVPVAELAKETPSPFCPDVLTGCAHTMVQDEDGVGVACAEWADAHEIEWRQSPAPVRGVSLGKATDPAPVAVRPVRTGESLVDVGGSMWWGVPAWVVRGWIAGHLAKGRYARASWLSGRLHSA